MNASKYLYLTSDLDRCGDFPDEALARFTERHRWMMPHFDFRPCVRDNGGAPKDDCAGVVIEMANGWPYRKHLRLAKKWIRSGKRAFFFWPGESAIEVADEERLRSYWNVVLFVAVWRRVFPLLQWARGVVHALFGRPLPPAVPQADNSIKTALIGWDQLIHESHPIPLTRLKCEGGRWKISGRGIYLRTDYWIKINSGGSYGHTCHVAHELAKASDGLTCFMAQRYSLLDEMGCQQVVVTPPFSQGFEEALLLANPHFYSQLKAAVEALAPAYIYERLVLGNFAGARLSHELGIPYLAEYNGSEISMKKSFDAGGYVHEDDFLRVEDAAFRQATAISVVSEHIKVDLIKRGIPAGKILVNPNGVDIETYAPPAVAEKNALRETLGFGADERVIGFIGTFGGWHGIEILAQALPAICERAPNARFLLIGDGQKKPLLDAVISRHHLWNRVHCTGNVPQQEGARLLKACDVFVSPHNSHMVGSRFFGSPTKIFEYMGMGAGIVASDLEQIGEVLSPALHPTDLTPTPPPIDDQRAILCSPGHVEEFVNAVVYLCHHSELAAALGANARKAAESEFAWSHHVQRLLAFAAGDSTTQWSTTSQASQRLAADSQNSRIATGDNYKDEVQNQWDNNPCGSQHVKEAEPHTLEWFLEAERYRYDEYAPWMPKTMEFAKHAGKKLLEVGGGMGTDHAQFAKNGAIVTDLDLSSGHLALAEESFRLRGLKGTFVHHDAESIPFDDNSFDVVYSNGVIHHTPNTQQLVDEIYRVLKPGGKAIIMVYAENSLHYWRNLVCLLGLIHGRLYSRSIGDIMSETVERSDNNARPLVKVYSARRLRMMFRKFSDISIVKRQMTPPEVPFVLSWFPTDTSGKLMGWNLVIKAYKPRQR